MFAIVRRSDLLPLCRNMSSREAQKAFKAMKNKKDCKIVREGDL